MHIVLFGDSWTQVENKALQDGLESNGATVHNYGVSGAEMQDIAGQIDRYVAEVSYDKSTVTHVAIVAGTNNVYFADKSVTNEQLQALGEKIHSVCSEHFPSIISLIILALLTAGVIIRIKILYKLCACILLCTLTCLTS